MSNPKPLDVTDLSIECNADGTSMVKLWCKCNSADDIEDVVAWLGFAQTMMAQWQARRDGHQ
jgi:hypothetical protein